MARTSDTASGDQDEPFSLGRSIVVGTVAGVIACYGFLNTLGYSDYSNSFWRDSPRVGTVAQSPSPANAPGPNEAQAPAPEQPADPNAAPTQDQQQAPQGQDPGQYPADDPNDSRPPAP